MRKLQTSAKFLLAMFLISNPIIAAADEDKSDHQHEGEEEEFNVDAYPLVLQGEQAFGEACYVGVLWQGKSRRGLYYAVVETSFQHEDEGPGRLVVTFDPQNSNVLSGKTQQGSEIRVELSSAARTIDEALSYAVRWTHEDHTDVGACYDLKVIKSSCSK